MVRVHGTSSSKRLPFSRMPSAETNFYSTHVGYVHVLRGHYSKAI